MRVTSKPYRARFGLGLRVWGEAGFLTGVNRSGTCRGLVAQGFMV